MCWRSPSRSTSAKQKCTRGRASCPASVVFYANVSLQEPPNRLATGPGIVVGLEHLQLVPFDQILSCEEHRRHLPLLDQPSQALGVNAQDTRSFHQVEVVIEGTDGHTLPFGH